MIRQITFLLCFSWLLPLKANNLTIDSLELVDSLHLSMRVSWDNSWRTSSGEHDAVWLFLKIRRTEWEHLDLSDNSSEHNAGSSDFEVLSVPDKKGLFLRRLNVGEGNSSGRITVAFSEKLLPGSYDIRAFATEMVWISAGDFYAGDSLSNNSLRIASSKAPYKISSEAEINVDSTGTALDNRIGSAPAANIPSSYPKGHEGFYMMKYEISQEQYADFLNTLTYSQQAARTAIAPSSPAGSFVMTASMQQSGRNAIIIKVPGSATVPAVYTVNADNDVTFMESNDGANRACNLLSWQDLTAFLDWAGLRPFTELEFEKACRGPVYPLPLEFAWGTDKVMDANTLQNDGTGNETVVEKGDSLTGVASHGYAGPQGPIRCGFNGSQSGSRTEMGASYYGCLELSGNIWEQCVALNSGGLNFTAACGDGKLTPSGAANVPTWDISGNSTAIRGGGWNSGIQAGFRDLAVSDRFYGFFNTSTRRNTTGGRGCRNL